MTNPEALVPVAQADIELFMAIFGFSEREVDADGDDARVLQLIARYRLAHSAAPASESKAWPDGFRAEYDDDDFTITWPDGTWLVAHRNGKLVTGRAPQDNKVAPTSTTIASLINPAPASELVEEKHSVALGLAQMITDIAIKCDGLSLDDYHVIREAAQVLREQASSLRARDAEVAAWLRNRAAPFECTADKEIANAIEAGEVGRGED